MDICAKKGLATMIRPIGALLGSYSHNRSEKQQQWDRLQSTRAEYLNISEELDGIIRAQWDSRASDLPQPNGLQLITNLENQRRVAFEKYKECLASYRTVMRRRSSLEELPVTDREIITVREREVLKCIAAGKTTKQIAEELGIAFKTAVAHRSHIMMKLDVHNTADLTRAAIRMGLIEP
jgi:DNA-binding CsgD family transcriptional regulator